MFSGIVEELGTVISNRIADSGRLDVAGSAVLADVRIGDSIAVNGCCLTVVDATPTQFGVDVMPETGRLTNLGAVGDGGRVNLEASLRLGERIGGHMVTGHIDGIGTVRSLRTEANALWVTVEAPDSVVRCLVSRGCVAVDGISLTVVDVLSDAFSVSLIPHTATVTTAGLWAPGSRVNLEADLVAKYVANAVGLQAGREVAEAPR